MNACANPVFILHRSGVTMGVINVISNYSIIKLHEQASDTKCCFLQQYSVLQPNRSRAVVLLHCALELKQEI